MSGALRKSFKSLREWLSETKTRLERLASGNGVPGTRAAPAKTKVNDQNIGVRLDYGEIVTKNGKRYAPLKLQVNKDAKSGGLKELLKQSKHGAHEVHAVGYVELDTNNKKVAATSALDEIDDQIAKKK